MTEIQRIKEKQIEIFFSKYYNIGFCNETYDIVPADTDDTFYYPDIDYSDKTRSRWAAAEHYRRIENELLVLGREGIKTFPEKRNKILGLVRYWLQHDYINPNWWHNQIGMPRSMTNIALALNDYLTDDMKEDMEILICRGSFKAQCMLKMSEIKDLDASVRMGNAYEWTGANLIWGAANTIKHALFTEDEELLRIAVDRISQEICFAQEGIQPDGAFCQHGPRWYSAGYGRSFVYELAPILYVLQGTSFELPKDKTEMFLLHVLDGLRLMHKNGYFDYNAVGREYSRPGMIAANSLIPAVELLSKTDGISRRTELLDFYTELTSGKDRYENTKYYNSICQLCHKENGVYIGVRGRTEGIFGAEKCNNEGVLSYNMSYGTVTCVMESGKEYFNLSPFWDYSKIPGTTAREETDEELLLHEGWNENLETPCRAYGKAGDKCAILKETAFHDGITVIASFFVFDGALVALGTDIKDEKPQKGKLYTTVEQCRSFNPIIQKDYVQNGNIIYRNLDSKTEFISLEQLKHGSWSRNEYAASKEILTDKLLTITIPVTGYNSYAYLVSGKKEPSVQVIRNDKDCQAILINSQQLMAVFHNDTQISVNEKIISGKKGELLIF